MKSTFCVSTTLFLLFLSIPLHAGGIQEPLLERIEMGPDAHHRAYIVMHERVDGPSLSASLNLNTYTRQARHAKLLNGMKDIARSSQNDLLELLESNSNDGTVKSFKGQWIANIVSVEATGWFLLEIAERADIETIHPMYDAELIRPVYSAAAPSEPMDTVDLALRVIGADSMWALGYTGEGRLVCNFDTGIDGNHPALSESWRGSNGYTPEESWFDPVDREDYPHVPTGSDPQHGTHTLGIMVGHDDLTGDTIGVAPDAQWISAAVVDIVGADILDAFAWAADPDGNPNTVDDVPDVVSHSWGFRTSTLGCDNVFWDAIDNLEALGCVCVFACGNEGLGGEQTIRNPANRASSPYNSFAVGSIDPRSTEYPVSASSSRGPSDCDGTSMKPQVVAPGVMIRSSIPGSTYGIKTGTSMAAPHVSGAVALLRQYNPNVPVDSLKRALIASAIDVDEAGPDFKSGFGLIHIPTALDYIGPNVDPHVIVSAVAHEFADPGDTLEIVVTLLNTGSGILSVDASLSSSSSNATVLNSLYNYGDLTTDDEISNTGNPFIVEIAPETTPGTSVSLILNVQSNGSYEVDIPLVINVGQRPDKAVFEHDVNNSTFAVSNFGMYGFASNSDVDSTFAGFKWPSGGGENNLYEMGLVIGTGPENVSDGVRNIFWVPDRDFVPAPTHDFVSIEPGDYAAQETYSVFGDSEAANPIGITISQYTLAFDSPNDSDYVTMLFRIRNDNDSALSNMYVGIQSDWDWPWLSAVDDTMGSDLSEDVAFMGHAWDPITYDSDDYRGIAVLSDPGITGLKTMRVDEYFLLDGDGLREYEKWGFMSGGIQDTRSDFFNRDRFLMVATGPFDVPAGDSVEVAFAVIGAASTAEMSENARAARARYNLVRVLRRGIEIDSVESEYKDEPPTVVDAPKEMDQLPREFTLSQNYPNPFNPSTQIGFYLDKPSDVRLVVYNLLGQRVNTLHAGYLPAGDHNVTWDASGNPSGIYFYRITTESHTAVRKMLLVK